MHISIAQDHKDDADTLVLFVSCHDKMTPESPVSEKLFEAMKQRGDFSGNYKETLVIYEKKHRVVLMGLGDEDELTDEKLRVLASVCMKQLGALKNGKIVHLEMPEGLKSKQQKALLEGLLLSNYKFDAYKKSEGGFESMHIMFAPKALKDDFHELEMIVSGVNFARDLVNLNADTVTPSRLAHEAIKLGATHPSIKTTVLRKKELEALKAGLILAVGQGSEEEPALIIMEYSGADDPHEKPEAIVGKGISFDTGGLNLKPTGSIEDMKCDMAGAACVLGVMHAAAHLKLKRNFIGVVASAENAIGPKSYKPGDVITSLSGKTVEINNTDAEGRLVLADAMTYIQKTYGVKKIIDLATLTGAILIALGEEAAGLFTRSKDLEQKLLTSAYHTGEKLWPMPLYDEYKDQLKSKIADMRNSGKRLAGASTGALFIESFIEDDVDWAHLDIAGVAFILEPKHYHSSQATGFGVRLLLNYLGV